jgi:hypothetical protein
MSSSSTPPATPTLVATPEPQNSARMKLVLTNNENAPATVLLSADSFNRANSGFPGSTDGAGSRDPIAWQQSAGGQVGINSNQLYCAVAGTEAFVDLGASDVDISVTLSVVDTNGEGILIRYTDSNNYVYMNGNFNTSWNLSKKVGGSFGAAIISSFGFINSGGGSVVRVKVTGNVYEVYIDGVLKGTGTDPVFNTVTKHGVRMGGTSQKMDNWQALGISLTGTSTRCTIERSIDGGLHWVKVRGIDSLDIPYNVPTTFYDYDLPPHASVQYRASCVSTSSGFPLQSSFATVTTQVNPKVNFLIDVTAPARNLHVMTQGQFQDATMSRDRAFFKAIGRQLPVVQRGTSKFNVLPDTDGR